MSVFISYKGDLYIYNNKKKLYEKLELLGNVLPDNLQYQNVVHYCGFFVVAQSVLLPSAPLLFAPSNEMKDNIRGSETVRYGRQ